MSDDIFNIASLKKLREEVHTFKIPARTLFFHRNFWEQEPIFRWSAEELDKAQQHPEKYIGTKMGVMCFLPMLMEVDD